MENSNNVVPTPPAGDASKRIANTEFVASAAGSASSGPSIAGLSVLGNASTVAATVAAITGTADQMLAVNHAATSVLFTSISSFIDSAIGSAQGAILYRNAATWTNLGPGTSGQFLKTLGAAADPAWANAGMVLLNTLTASNSSSLTDSTSFTSTYKCYEIQFFAMVPSTAAQMQMQVATNGTTFLAASYVGATLSINNTNVLGALQAATTLLLSGTINSSANYGLNGFLRVYNPSGGATRTFFNAMTDYQTSPGTGSANYVQYRASGYQDGANTAINAVQVSFVSATAVSGVIKVYGIT